MPHTNFKAYPRVLKKHFFENTGGRLEVGAGYGESHGRGVAYADELRDEVFQGDGGVAVREHRHSCLFGMIPPEALL